MASLLYRSTHRVLPTCQRLVSRPSLLGASSPQATLGVQKRWLPLCAIETNVPKEAISADFLPGLSKLIADTLDKPEKLISITLRTDVQVFRDGHSGPSAAVNIWSIGVFDEQRNPGYSKAFVDYLAPKLGMPTDRIAIFFHPITKTQAGHLLYTDQIKK